MNEQQESGDGVIFRTDLSKLWISIIRIRASVRLEMTSGILS